MAKQRSDGEVEVRRPPDGRYEARLRVDGTRHSVYGATRAEVVALRCEHVHLDASPPVLLSEARCRAWTAMVRL